MPRFSHLDLTGASPLWLAVGAEDGSIHTFRFKDPLCKLRSHTGAETVTKVAVLCGHEAPIYDLSFPTSQDEMMLLSVDSLGQALAFDVEMGRRLQSIAQIRDGRFVCWTSPIGWQVLGCWDPEKQPAGGKAPAALPRRRFCEIGGGLKAIAASQDASPTVELFPFPCPIQPREPCPRLDGPASSISALAYEELSGRLLVSSDVLVFVWGWDEAPDGPCAPGYGSPLRPLQGSALVETPDGAMKRVIAMPGTPLTPQRPSPPPTGPGERRGGKENPAVPQVWQAEEDEPRRMMRAFKLGVEGGLEFKPSPRFSEAPPSVYENLKEIAHLPEEARRDLMREHTSLEEEVLADDAEPVGRARSTGALRRGGGLAATTPAPLRRGAAAFEGGSTWASPPFPGGSPGLAEARERRRKMHEVQPKIGSREAQDLHGEAMLREMRLEKERIESRARGIRERHGLDTVGALMRGDAGRRRSSSAAGVRTPPEMIPAEVPARAIQAQRGVQDLEGSCGRFLYRLHDDGRHYEVEAQLPGGRLTKVLRNSVRQTISFEGEVFSHWTYAGRPGSASSQGSSLMESMTVRLPEGFDLTRPPAHVEKAFAEGRCLLVVHRQAAASLGAPLRAPSEAWADGNNV